MLACVPEPLREDMLSEWDELLSQATQCFFPKIPKALPEGQDRIVARRLWRVPIKRCLVGTFSKGVAPRACSKAPSRL